MSTRSLPTRVLLALLVSGCNSYWSVADAGPGAGGANDHLLPHPEEADASPADDRNDPDPPDVAPLNPLAIEYPARDLLEPPNDTVGHVVYGEGGHAYRIRPVPGAVPEDLTAILDTLSPGKESVVNLSPDGEWVLLDTTRFGCADYPCLALFKIDFTILGRIEIDGEPVHNSGRHPAISSGGDLVVYSAAGTHLMDLFAIRWTGTEWTQPVELTTASPKQFHHDPALSDDGSKVLMDCGPDPYGVHASSICEVDTDGSNFHVAISPVLGGTASNALHQPDYGPDGSIYFEADWDGEKVWVLGAGKDRPLLASPHQIHDDNSPCVMPNRQVISLWLNRPGNDYGFHELKAMSPNGLLYEMFVTDIDVADIGMGCGR